VNSGSPKRRLRKRAQDRRYLPYPPFLQNPRRVITSRKSDSSRPFSQCDQSSSIVSAARRSPGFSLRNIARAFLMSRSEPLSAAAAPKASRA